ncbi:MAG: hypothetical protein HKO86_03900 [Gammaproteobacteria bacterium]|nr:hypothetical protein [Gammaproteobacteria bacterium]
MSGGIQLSGELINAVKESLVKHDAAAEDDLMTMQYLSAIIGYVLAHQTNPALNKRGFLNDLSTFMGQVLDQVESDMRPQQPSLEAFGIWRPGEG